MSILEILSLRDKSMDNIANVFAGISVFYFVTFFIAIFFIPGGGASEIIMITTFVVASTIAPVLMCKILLYLYLTDILKEA